MAIVNSSVVLPVDYARGVITGLLGRSKALELGYELPRMRGKTTRLNVLSALPYAYWVKNSATPTDGNTPNGYPSEIKNKPLTQLAWAGKDVIAETIACIVPVSKETLADVSDYVDLAGVIQEQVIGAFQEVIDATLFFGTNSPWADYAGVVPASKTAGAVVNWDGQEGLSFYYAVSDAMEYVETSGYIPDAILGGPRLNSALRRAITALGINVMDQGQIGGLYKHISLTGGFNEDDAFAIVGDFKRGLVFAFREEINMSLSQDATLVDPSTGNVLYNLFQQDMVAFRFELRMGAQIANPVNRINSTDNRFPFAVITKAGGSN